MAKPLKTGMNPHGGSPPSWNGVVMNRSRDDAAAFYRRYLTRCNEHHFDDLGEFVAADVNGPAEGLDHYIAGLHAVTAAFPDYHWDLHRLLLDGQWLAARLTGTGTHTFRGITATGRRIRTQELVIYRLAQAKIAEVWGDLGSTVRDELTHPDTATLDPTASKPPRPDRLPPVTPPARQR